jgi:hypothetical protein
MTLFPRHFLLQQSGGGSVSHPPPRQASRMLAVRNGETGVSVSYRRLLDGKGQGRVWRRRSRSGLAKNCRGERVDDAGRSPACAL